MIVAPRLRKAALTAHVAVSVGWLGAIVVFLGLAVVGLASDDPATVRGAYLVMEPLAWFVLVPLALASLVSGLAQSLVTKWGIVRHYWVIAKLVINLAASAVLLLYTETLEGLADSARSGMGAETLKNPSPLLHAGAGVVLLGLATALSVFKPRGVTPYGFRKQVEERAIANR